MNEQEFDHRAASGFLRRFRNVMLLLFLVAAFLVFGGLSWGTSSIPLVVLIGVGVAMLPGILFIAFGIVLGIIVGWSAALLGLFKRLVRA
jgi:hypothetical protein